MKGVFCAIAAAATLFAACALPSVALAAPGKVQTSADSVTVLKQDPYYLSIHRPDRARPKGTILALPGGGWTDNSQAGLVEDKMGDWIKRLLDLGFQVAAVGPRGGTYSIEDAVSAFDYVHKEFPRQEICALGGSSGAHLALWVAIDRGSEVTCVVDHAGPPNLEQKPTPSKFWPFSFIVSKVSELTKAATQAFGTAQLSELSPINHVSQITAPVFIAAAPCDPYIPLSDQQNFASQLEANGTSAQLFTFQPGNEAYASHCGVTMSSFLAYEHAEDAFLNNHLGARAAKHLRQ